MLQGQGEDPAPLDFPLRAPEHSVIQNRAVTDKPAGHSCTLGIESNFYLCLIQIATDELGMSTDRGSKKPSLVKTGLLEGATVREEGVRVGISL